MTKFYGRSPGMNAIEYLKCLVAWQRWFLKHVEVRVYEQRIFVFVWKTTTYHWYSK